MVVPTPDEAPVSCPGCARASAINSFTDFAATPGCITRNDGELVASVTGSRSRAGSKRMLRYMLGIMAIAELVHSMV